MPSHASLGDDTRLRLSEHVLTRSVGEETVLLSLENEQYYGVKEVGARFVALIETGATLGDAIDALLVEYDVDPEVLRRDIEALVDALRRNGLVELDAA